MSQLLPNTEYLHDRTHAYRLAVYFAAESAKRLLHGVDIYDGYLNARESELLDTIEQQLRSLMQSLDTTPIQNLTESESV